MPTVRSLMPQFKISRGDDSKAAEDDVTYILVIVLGMIVALGVLCLVFSLVQKRIRSQRLRESHSPPKYNYCRHENGRNHQQLTIETRNGRSNVVLYNKHGQPMLLNPNSPPNSPDNVPEIRITFPDDEDDGGKRKSGRVVIVRVGDNAAVGLEPLDEDELSVSEKESNADFYSIDVDDIGGLKESHKWRDAFYLDRSQILSCRDSAYSLCRRHDDQLFVKTYPGTRGSRPSRRLPGR